MRILGIVAEYDPLHRGHERHLRMAQEKVQPDFTWIAMSGSWKQRGEMSLLSPYDRAFCALEAGADAVFLLPAAWSVRDAEHYALGAVSLLKELGATHLAFGAEKDDLPGMLKAAGLLEQSTEALKQELQKLLKIGRGYPRAIAEAIGKIYPELQGILNSPNNLLAVCYLRSMLKINAEMVPVLIPRNGDYHCETIEAKAPSASAVRNAIRCGNYRDAFSAVPEYTKRMIRHAMVTQRIPDEKKMDALMIYRLRDMTKEAIRILPGVSEGLEERIAYAAKICQTREQILEMVSTSRYSKARISRICAWAMLGNYEDIPEITNGAAETVLLGMKRIPEMTRLWRRGSVKIFSSMKETEGRRLWQSELQGWNLWNLCAGLPMDDFFRQKMLIR